MRTVLGNLEDLKDYHRHTLLPKLEDAVQDSQLIRCYQIPRNWTEMLKFIKNSISTLHIYTYKYFMYIYIFFFMYHC